MLPEPRVAETPLRTKYGLFTMYVFSWSDNEQDNVLTLVPESMNRSPATVRIQSACYSGEIFESLDCDCHWQLETSLKIVQEERGAFIYMLRDGRGAGLLAKVRGMRLTSTQGLDTAEAYKVLGVPPDPRDYEQAAYVLRYLQVSSVRLLTNNPRKVEGLEMAGYQVERIRLESVPTEENKEYLRAKATKHGHLMQTFGTG